MSRSLERVQRDFAAMLLDPRPPSGRAQIYHHNRRANFRKALALEYPLIERIVGAEFFARLAFEFMAAHPSRSGDLHHVGEAFPAFLAAGLASRGSAYEYLVDLARLEWAWQCALIAADAPALGSDALAAFTPEDWPKLRFVLQPALQVIASPWPLHTLFLEQRREQPGIVHLDSGAECAVVLRQAGIVEVHRLEAHDAVLWQSLASGNALEVALEAALRASSQSAPPAVDPADPATAPAFDLGTALSRLFALGAVTEITVVEAGA